MNMKIRQIRLKNFKRFSDATIGDIPAEVRVVLVVGPNGCGKSSLADAVNLWYRQHYAKAGNWQEDYHRKQVSGASENWSQVVQLTFHDPQPDTEDKRRKAIYVRTAYRNEPEFMLEQLSRVGPAVQEHRVSRMIDNDQAVSLNYRRLVSEGFEYAYEKGAGSETLEAFRERSIGSIRDAMRRLFPDLVLNSLGNPLTSGTFRFSKGESSGFLYKNLSGGEKAAFDLLLDILVKRREFDDTAFFIDEPEAHISTALQAALLDELYKAVPEHSQLWISTHSIGMMRKARELERKVPGSVAFIDFDGLNFDVPTKVEPTLTDRPFWKRAMQVALDEMAGYVAPERVVLCEGGSVAGGSDFDASCYNAIFSLEEPDALFLGGGSADEIAQDPRKVAQFIRAMAPSTALIRLIDRDDRRDDEIATLQERGIRVLSLRNIESYLLDDEVLDALCHHLGDGTQTMALLAAKTMAIEGSISAGGPSDDFKRIAGDVFNATKRLFPGIKLGADKRAFMSGVCAPLIRPSTAIYRRLRSDVFGV